VDRIRRVAEQKPERARRRRRPRVQLGRETRPVHHIEPEAGHRGEVLYRDAEQLQAFLHPPPESRSFQQGRQKECVMHGAVEIAACVQLQQAGTTLDAPREHLPYGVYPHRFSRLAIRQPHV
jgi:hypothetical protein